MCVCVCVCVQVEVQKVQKAFEQSHLVQWLEKAVIENVKGKILVLLDLVTFTNVPFPDLELQCFDQSALEAAIQSCDQEVRVIHWRSLASQEVFNCH